MSARERLLDALSPAVVDALDAWIEERLELRAAEQGRKPYLAVPAAAVYVGVSQRTVRRWIKEERVRITRLDRRVLVERASLDALLRGD